MMVMMMIFNSRQCHSYNSNEEVEGDYSPPCLDCVADDIANLPLKERVRLGAGVLARTVVDIGREVAATVRNLKGQIIPKARELIRTAKPAMRKLATTIREGAEYVATELNTAIGKEMTRNMPEGEEKQRVECEEKIYDNPKRDTNVLKTAKHEVRKVQRQVASTVKNFYRALAKKTSEAGKWDSKPVLGLSPPLASIFYPFLVSSVLAYLIFSRARFVDVFNYLVCRQLFVLIVYGLSKIFFGSSGSKSIRVFVESFTFGVFVYSFKFEIMKVITIALVSVATWVLVWVKAEPTQFLGTSYASDLIERAETSEALSTGEENLIDAQRDLFREFKDTAKDQEVALRVEQGEELY